MERGNILVVAVVTAAVALFALARFSPSPSDSRTDVSDDARYGDGSAESARVGGADRSYAGGGGGEAGSEEGRKPALGSLGERRPGGVGREPMHLAKQTGPTGRRSESAVSILGKERERGKVGVSGSQREISSGGSGVTINESGRPSNLGDVGSSRTERRSNLVDFLAEQPLGTNSVLEDDVSKDPDEENTDVVLSVPLDRESGTVANDDTPPLVEHELEFGEDGVGMKFDAGSVLAFPDAGNVRGDAGSLALEFQPEWSGAEKGDYSLVNVRTPNDPTNSLRLFKNGRYLRLLFADNTGRERNIGYDMVDWEPGELHTVAATWDQGALSLYVDNQLVGTNYYEGQLEIRPGTPLYLGSDVPEAPLSGANATISNFRVYGRALSNDEVLNYRFPTDEN